MKDKSIEDVCKLIEFCNNNNVKEFKLDGMELIFRDEYSSKDVRPEKAPLVVDSNISAPEPIEEVDPALLQQLEADIKQAELDQMMINDPVQFEELLNVGDFVNDTERTTND